MDDYYEEDITNDIISQLKAGTMRTDDIEKNYPNLTPDQIDDFILKYSSMTVIDLSDSLRELSKTLSIGATDKEIIAVAELGHAIRGNLELLQKRKIASENNETKVEIKRMDIDSKKESSDANDRIGMTREEVYKLLREKRTEKLTAKDNGVIDV